MAACRSPIPPLGCVFSFFLSFPWAPGNADGLPVPPPSAACWQKKNSSRKAFPYPLACLFSFFLSFPLSLVWRVEAPPTQGTLSEDPLLFRGLAGALLQETSGERACASTRQIPRFGHSLCSLLIKSEGRPTGGLRELKRPNDFMSGSKGSAFWLSVFLSLFVAKYVVFSQIQGSYQLGDHCGHERERAGEQRLP